jgi:hypothetical protein
MAGADPAVVALKEPITFGSEFVTELRFRRPKAKDFRRLPLEPGLGDMLDLIGGLTGQPKAVVDELGVEDMRKALEVVGSFLPAGPATGGTASP